MQTATNLELSVRNIWVNCKGSWLSGGQIPPHETSPHFSFHLFPFISPSCLIFLPFSLHLSSFLLFHLSLSSFLPSYISSFSKQSDRQLTDWLTDWLADWLVHQLSDVTTIFNIHWMYEGENLSKHQKLQTSLSQTVRVCHDDIKHGHYPPEEWCSVEVHPVRGKQPNSDLDKWHWLS